jgi:hypothetical protein
MPPLFTSGYFVAAVMLVVDRFGQMVCRPGSLVGWMLCHLRVWRPFSIMTSVYLLADPIAWSCLGSWVRVSYFPVVLAAFFSVGIACYLLNGAL